MHAKRSQKEKPLRTCRCAVIAGTYIEFHFLVLGIREFKPRAGHVQIDRDLDHVHIDPDLDHVQIDHALDDLVPHMPLWEFVQDLYTRSPDRSNP